MKHIKLFEDYSDEELDALQQDLEGIGHEYKLLQKGKDFGYGTALHDGSSQGYPLYFNKLGIKKLEDKGIIAKPYPDANYYQFTDPKIKADITLFGTNLFRIAFYAGNAKSRYLKIEKYLSDLRK
jgi:hypothetical protein